MTREPHTSAEAAIAMTTEREERRARFELPLTKSDHRQFRIVEIFDSCKGEGTQAGIPMTFVRFAGCNLGCHWCDTQYNRAAFTPTHQELVSLLERREPRWIVFTGGEPMMQLTPALCQVIHDDLKASIALETNGLVFDPAVFEQLDYINISPKCYRTRPEVDPLSEEERIAPEIVKWANEGGTIHEVRFVVDHAKYDLWDLGFSPEWRTISPLMEEPTPLPAGWVSGDGFNNLHGVFNRTCLNRALYLVHKYRHDDARLSIQCHKFVGVR